MGCSRVDDDVGKVLGDWTLEFIRDAVAHGYGESVRGLFDARVLVHKLREDRVENSLRDRLTLVKKRYKNIRHKRLHLLVHRAPPHNIKEGGEKLEHELIPRRQIADEDGTLDSGQGLEEVKVLIMIWRVREFETLLELTNKELKDVAELWLGIRCIWSIEPQELSQTTSRVRAYALVLVKEDSLVNEFRTGICE